MYIIKRGTDREREREEREGGRCQSDSNIEERWRIHLISSTYTELIFCSRKGHSVKCSILVSDLSKERRAVSDAYNWQERQVLDIIAECF